LQKLWHQDAEKRPKARKIDKVIFNNLVNYQLPNELAKTFWKKNLHKSEAPIDDVLNIFIEVGSYPVKLNEYTCLKELILQNNSGKISIEQFGTMFKWFGSSNDVVINALALCNYDWFFGNISREETERLLFCTSNKYIVRMTAIETNPKNIQKDILTHPFSISYKLENDEKVSHQRVLYDPDTHKYKTDSSISDHDTVIGIVEEIAKTHNLYPLGGSKYKMIIDQPLNKDTGYIDGQIRYVNQKNNHVKNLNILM